MRDVAKKRELSDNGLRKHFVKAFVNLPPQGHWNKLKAGHKVKITPLPPGISDTISIGNWDCPLARVPVGNLIRLASEAESRNVSIL